MSASLTSVPIWYRVPKPFTPPPFFNQMVKNQAARKIFASRFQTVYYLYSKWSGRWGSNP